jgi:hypothetical protein
VAVKLTEHIRFYSFPLAGIDAMAAATPRTFPRHTHDQYGMGVIEAPGELLQFCPRSPAPQDGTLAPSSQGVEIMQSRYVGFLRLAAVARKINSQDLQP